VGAVRKQDACWGDRGPGASEAVESTGLAAGCDPAAVVGGAAGDYCSACSGAEHPGGPPMGKPPGSLSLHTLLADVS
jgi:hypothetical protein